MFLRRVEKQDVECATGIDHAIADVNVVVPVLYEIGEEDYTMGSIELFGLR